MLQTKTREKIIIMIIHGIDLSGVFSWVFLRRLGVWIGGGSWGICSLFPLFPFFFSFLARVNDSTRSLGLEEFDLRRRKRRMALISGAETDMEDQVSLSALSS